MRTHFIECCRFDDCSRLDDSLFQSLICKDIDLGNTESLSEEELFYKVLPIINNAAILFSSVYYLEREEVYDEGCLIFWENKNDFIGDPQGRVKQRLSRKLNTYLTHYVKRNDSLLCDCSKIEFVEDYPIEQFLNRELIKLLFIGINPKNMRALEMHLEGYTLREIKEEIVTTREYARQRIIKALYKVNLNVTKYFSA